MPATRPCPQVPPDAQLVAAHNRRVVNAQLGRGRPRDQRRAQREKPRRTTWGQVCAEVHKQAKPPAQLANCQTYELYAATRVWWCFTVYEPPRGEPIILTTHKNLKAVVAQITTAVYRGAHQLESTTDPLLIGPRQLTRTVQRFGAGCTPAVDPSRLEACFYELVASASRASESWIRPSDGTRFLWLTRVRVRALLLAAVERLDQ